MPLQGVGWGWGGTPGATPSSIRVGGWPSPTPSPPVVVQSVHKHFAWLKASTMQPATSAAPQSSPAASLPHTRTLCQSPPVPPHVRRTAATLCLCRAQMTPPAVQPSRTALCRRTLLLSSARCCPTSLSPATPAGGLGQGAVLPECGYNCLHRTNCNCLHCSAVRVKCSAVRVRCSAGSSCQQACSCPLGKEP